MDETEALAHFRETGAMLEGHFILSSGRRSGIYLQCARVLMHADRAAALCQALAGKIRSALGADGLDLVVSPAMGGVIAGYELGRQLGLPAIFTERVDGSFTVRRGFDIAPDARVVMAEDIITTGKSSRECIDCIQSLGGRVVAASCLIDRSGGEVDLGVPLFSLARLSIPTYDATALPPDLAALDAVKPGSRGLA